MNNNNRGEAKYRGRHSAKEWCRSATIQEQIRVAGCGFEYGDLLNDLVFDGLKVPNSEDIDFSWGFFKQVKCQVYHAMFIARSEQQQCPTEPKQAINSHVATRSGTKSNKPQTK